MGKNGGKRSFAGGKDDKSSKIPKSDMSEKITEVTEVTDVTEFIESPDSPSPLGSPGLTQLTPVELKEMAVSALLKEGKSYADVAKFKGVYIYIHSGLHDRLPLTEEKIYTRIVQQINASATKALMEDTPYPDIKYLYFLTNYVQKLSTKTFYCGP